MILDEEIIFHTINLDNWTIAPPFWIRTSNSHNPVWVRTSDSSALSPQDQLHCKVLHFISFNWFGDTSQCWHSYFTCQMVVYWHPRLSIHDLSAVCSASYRRLNPLGHNEGRALPLWRLDEIAITVLALMLWKSASACNEAISKSFARTWWLAE